ncbi:MAG: pyridoxal kinase [Rhizomicrobium sp.]|jgi:pyridoxine kinase
MKILSIQSEVVYGHVGNRAARFAFERLGFEAWTIPTILLSSHAGYARVEGEATDTCLMRRLIDGLDGNGWLGQCDAVLSGYLGHADQADVVADAVRRVKAANTRAIYCLDPVFGDGTRAYAKPGVADAMAQRLLPLADIVAPNIFELSSLTGVVIQDTRDALAAAKQLDRPVVVVTSVPAGDRIGALVVEGAEAWLATTPRLESAPHGAGDLFAALFVAAKLSGRDSSDALAHATASVFHILSASAGYREMLLPAEQDALVEPPLQFVQIERSA